MLLKDSNHVVNSLTLNVKETDMYDLTTALILLSWSSHVDSWCGGMSTFSDGIVHPDAPPVQLHAIGSLHCLRKTRGRRRQRCHQTIGRVFGTNHLFHKGPLTLHTVTLSL